jgi:hypothetical protein
MASVAKYGARLSRRNPSERAAESLGDRDCDCTIGTAPPTT